jgi:hypothetical protein
MSEPVPPRESAKDAEPPAPASHLDPTRAGAAFVSGARRHGGRPIFDWLDGVLIFAGLSTMVVLGVVAAGLSPALAGALPNLGIVFATLFAFGPVLVRRAKFPRTLAWAGVPRDGAGYRVLSVVGLLLTAFSSLCLVMVIGGLIAGAGGPPVGGVDEESRLQFVDEQLARLGPSPGEGADPIRLLAERAWEAERTTRLARAEADAAVSGRSRLVAAIGALALVVGILLMRLRYDRGTGRPR